LTLAGGVLDIEELSGRLYGAPAKLRARFTDTSPPTAALALTLQGADLEAVLIDAAEIDFSSGKLDLTARFQAQGRSEQELVSALGGEGSVAVRQGLIKGINLGRLNTQLANIDNEIALVGLIGDALSGGVTPIHNLDGTFSASNGVIRSTDFRAVLDGGEGSAVTTVDLPRWQLSMNSEFRLTGHPNAPPIGLLLMGPIDNPQREIRDKALKAHITEKVFSTVARKLAPAVTGQSGVVGGLLEALAGSGQAPQETAPAEGDPIPPPEASPENLFENLLQDIIQDN
ncbi:MAG: AsmA-like C-terminal region-containing protein, partial [Pseudomonadota bacterium]|nr:AsmA-like C-terminal region-containing protein [Pseudomonadota bacterium]